MASRRSYRCDYLLRLVRPRDGIADHPDHAFPIILRSSDSCARDSPVFQLRLVNVSEIVKTLVISEASASVPLQADEEALRIAAFQLRREIAVCIERFDFGANFAGPLGVVRPKHH